MNIYCDSKYLYIEVVNCSSFSSTLSNEQFSFLLSNRQFAKKKLFKYRFKMEAILSILLGKFNQKNKLDQTGTFNNNISLNLEKGVIVMIAIIVTVLVLFFFITIYSKHRRGLKKMYANRNDLP